ncbi:MAG: hypothetical protein H3Z53_12355 [archaeon]|nr:hypothetical protein [archaeon]MCP8315141.1 hypothetical protein [archaeon]
MKQPQKAPCNPYERGEENFHTKTGPETASPPHPLPLKVEIPLKIYKRLKEVRRLLKEEGINPVPSIHDIGTSLLLDFLNWPKIKQDEFIKEIKEKPNIVEIDYEIHKKLRQVQKELKDEGVNPPSTDQIVNTALKAFFSLPKFNQIEIIEEMKHEP